MVDTTFKQKAKNNHIVFDTTFIEMRKKNQESQLGINRIQRQRMASSEERLRNQLRQSPITQREHSQDAADLKVSTYS